MSLVKRIRNWVVFIIIICISIIRFNNSYDFYTVCYGSMFPTLKGGDILLVKKLKFTKLNFVLKKGSIYVFSIPAYDSNKKYYPGLNSDLKVKRCVGLPDDTLQYIDNQLFVNSNLGKVSYANSIKFDKKWMLNISNPIYGINLNNFYPHDSTFNWNTNNYGPIYIPKKNTKIKLTESLKILYKDIVLFETLDISNLVIDEYIFKNDYYYFVGDNFYGSTDSRHWGLIPKENIIAEVKCIVWSRSFKTIFKRLK